MSVQPLHQEPDPQDPQVIMERLPEQERDFFLAQYRERAHAAADDLTGYKALQRFLNVWSIRARTRRPSSEELEARIQEIRDGAPTIPIEDVLVQHLGMSRAEAAAWWQQKVEQAAEGR
ncbi:MULTISPECIES: DUF6247 family protein [unclassified Actinomadura]|uniref:DUF6247 family protein n=1 Tax=unclassified Actinomadura TaxID=2626254 RepID=UPI0011EDCB43|nr:DUF6247 family protein [Actinomadura sp. K4S16]